MFKRFISLFDILGPNRSDTRWILFGLMLISAVLTPELILFNLEYSQTAELFVWNFAALLIIGTSIGAGLGTFDWRQLSRSRWFAISIVGVLLFCGFLLQREHLLWRDQPFGGSGSTKPAGMVPFLSCWLLCIAGTLGGWGVTRLLFLIIETVKRVFQIGTFTRQQLLVGIAIVLFLLLTARNVFTNLGLQWNQIGEVALHPVVRLATGLAALLVVAAIPAWLISSLRGGWGWLVSIVYLGAITGLTSMILPLTAQLLLAIYALVFSSIVVTLTLDRNTPGNAESSTLPPRQTRRFWGTAVVLLAVATTIVFYNFSLSGLVLGGDNRIEIARRLKQISTSRGVETSFSIWPTPLAAVSRVSWIRAEIAFKTSNPDATCLNRLSNLPNTINLNLHGVNPAIDTAKLRSVNLTNGSVTNSRLTAQQIEDIFYQSANVVLSDCQFEESAEPEGSVYSGSIGLTATGRVHLIDMPANETGKFLAMIDVDRFPGGVWIGGGDFLTENDWTQILECSRSYPVVVYQSPPMNVVEELIRNDSESKRPERQLTCGYGIQPDRIYWQLILKTSLNIPCRNPATHEDLQRFWDAAFVSRGTDWAVGVLKRMDKPRNDTDLGELGRKYHWSFDSNQQGDPQGMILPFVDEFIEQIAGMRQLTTLSLDPRWLYALTSFDFDDIPRPEDMSRLGKLTKLKRLDLPIGLWVSDFGWLKDLPELEHLQFDTFIDGRKQVNFGFSAADCPNLKSLVLFGQPSRPLALEISKLPALESLKLVDIDQSLTQSGRKEQIQKAIGREIQLTIVGLDSDRPDLPNEFIDHLEKVRAGVQEKYLSDNLDDGQ